MKYFIKISLISITVSMSLNAASVALEKSIFKVGEVININFNTPSNFSKNAWIGIIPSNVAHGSEDVNDQHDVSYQYLKLKKNGTLKFTAPLKAGNYDARLNDTDANGKEVAFASFKVLANTQTRDSQESYLKLTQYQFKKGEAIHVKFQTPKSFSKNAWVGIIPSNIAHGNESLNDRHDVSYQYLNKQNSGTLIFKAPLKAGDYDLRLNDTDANGKEVTYVPFKVL